MTSSIRACWGQVIFCSFVEVFGRTSTSSDFCRALFKPVGGKLMGLRSPPHGDSQDSFNQHLPPSHDRGRRFKTRASPCVAADTTTPPIAPSRSLCKYHALVVSRVHPRSLLSPPRRKAGPIPHLRARQPPNLTSGRPLIAAGTKMPHNSRSSGLGKS